MTKKVKSALETQVGGNHYKTMPIQPAEYCHVNRIPKLEGDAIAYLSRWRLKGGLQDLEKAIHTIQLLIQLEQAAISKANRKAKRAKPQADETLEKESPASS